MQKNNKKLLQKVWLGCLIITIILFIFMLIVKHAKLQPFWNKETDKATSVYITLQWIFLGFFVISLQELGIIFLPLLYLIMERS